MRKKNYNKYNRLLLIALVLLISASPALAQPLVPGFNVDVYANIIKPLGLAFDPDGILYVGNNTSNTDPIKIRRVGLGGFPIEEYGNAGLIGPDNVAFDASGSISGQPGSVLVAGIDEWSGGVPTNAYIAAILPDESIKIIFTGSPIVAPIDMSFDRYGRLLIGDFPGLFVTTGQALALLTPPGFNPVSSANFFSVDGGGRIFFSNEVGPPYDTIEIRIVNADGTLLNEPFLSFTNTGNQKLSFSPFDATWNGDLLTLDFSGILRRIDAKGNVNIFGSGFEGAGDIVFGPDGALYISDTTSNLVYRITPSSEPNQPPEAICQDVTVATKPGLCSADASVDDGSFDPDGDDITLEQTPPGPYELGDTEVALTVTDDKGLSDECTATITVVDEEAPVISSVTANPNKLWPPNHKMVPVTVSVNASDNCDSSCRIISVASNEPVNGLGDGDTAPDWVIIGDLTVKLRAERSGKGNGRVYTITVECKDVSDNSATKTVKVTVSHDKGKKNNNKMKK